MRNEQASTFSDKIEIENLFLDCIDENRKEVLRHFTQRNSEDQTASAAGTRRRGPSGASD